ncbi:MAG TPA: hypothetical protein ENK57_16700, partial [Polyangiaceae bacterium]|nr:hypothetical protein [Polyangiaceae bacterium]
MPAASRIRHPGGSGRRLTAYSSASSSPAHANAAGQRWHSLDPGRRCVGPAHARATGPTQRCATAGKYGAVRAARRAHQQRRAVASCHAQARYVPRPTQGSDALALVREHWPAFRQRLEERAGSLPGFVRDELEAFITCGDFGHGFLVAQCARCGDSQRVPFACKSRGICPSCMGRRMAETAALLARHRLPEV